MIYGALVRAAFALGYDSVVTYTLASEPGTSLRASGWSVDRVSDPTEARAWNSSGDSIRSADRPALFYEPKQPTDRKVRWRISRERR